MVYYYNNHQYEAGYVQGEILMQVMVYIAAYICVKCLRPYHVENTSSRPITEVKQH